MPSRGRKPAPPRIYVDSCVYLDLIMKNEEINPSTGAPRWRDAKMVFDAVNADRAVLAASALIEAEVCCHGEARRPDTRTAELLRKWFTAPSTAWADVDRFVARDAARLAETHAHERENSKRSFSGADATHLAAAIRLGCDYLFTHDQGFQIGHQIEGVRVMRPERVWPETLLDRLADEQGA